VIFLATTVGYLLGSVPTAGWIGRASGIDLRSDGSRNPGANNARRLGGTRLAATILIVEIGKGVAVVVSGVALAGSAGAVAAGLGALAGNIYNVWYRFAGGQGLGISAGILLAAWPLYFPIALGVIALVTATTRRTAKAALAAMVALIIGAILSFTVGYPSGWGIGDPASGMLALGMVVLITPKQIAKLRSSR
jgi:glycerol-3-phosphate acyltransferase PlsY